MDSIVPNYFLLQGVHLFISVLEIFKIGIGPSSSHTMGPLLAAQRFRNEIKNYLKKNTHIDCHLLGSLAYTGKGHCIDQAIVLGLHDYSTKTLANLNIQELFQNLKKQNTLDIGEIEVKFNCESNIHYNTNQTHDLHPNTLIFKLLDADDKCIFEKTYFSIGGGFINTMDDINQLSAPLTLHDDDHYPYPFKDANSMLEMARSSGLSIAQMKRANELQQITQTELDQGLRSLWQNMEKCLLAGLKTDGELPGQLHIERRAKNLYHKLKTLKQVELNDWLCCYAMSVNEENAAGHTVVTAPTNGAAGIIPAILYFMVKHRSFTDRQIHDYLLTASAIGGIIKQNSSISGAEVGCQGEVGSAAAMAAAALCEALGGTPQQAENAAEIALEHHLGLTCDPVAGLVQIPCIERNGFGAIKAFSASSLALYGTGKHYVSLDKCIAAMQQTGEEMSNKFKETSLGGLAVSMTEC